MKKSRIVKIKLKKIKLKLWGSLQKWVVDKGKSSRSLIKNKSAFAGLIPQSLPRLQENGIVDMNRPTVIKIFFGVLAVASSLSSLMFYVLPYYHG